jgi:nicotinate-nucleotide pyrophosphorylase (carboxylating)
MTTDPRTDYRMDWNALTLPQLFDELARADAVIAVERALAEDLGAAGISGDVTSAVTIAPTARGRARVVSRSSGVVAGLRVAEIIAQRAGLTLTVHVDDGSRVERGTRIASLEGPLVSLLAHERTMLNFLTLLSGNATLAAQFVDAVHPSRAAICDTRKTIPGLRTLQKYASRCGGATLHRIGLYDAVLIKDNHLGSFEAAQLAERVREASMQARAQRTIAFVECEVDSLAQFDRLLTLEVGVLDMVLLDNMEPAMLSEAVRRRDARAPHLLLEASGGVRLDTVRRIAASGVDRISVGAITHSANALDIGLDMDASLSGA